MNLYSCTVLAYNSNSNIHDKWDDTDNDTDDADTVFHKLLLVSVTTGTDWKSSPQCLFIHHTLSVKAPSLGL